MSLVSERIRAAQVARGRACFDKQVYASEQLALQTKKAAWCARNLQAKFCEECGAWHLIDTRRARGKARRW